MHARTALFLLLALGSAAQADDAAPAAQRELAAVAELGRVNGTALACERADLVVKARALMLARVPKTRRYGEAFEEATNTAFREQTASLATCPEGAILGLHLEAADLRLAEAFPPQTQQ